MRATVRFSLRPPCPQPTRLSGHSGVLTCVLETQSPCVGAVTLPAQCPRLWVSASAATVAAGPSRLRVGLAWCPGLAVGDVVPAPSSPRRDDDTMAAPEGGFGDVRGEEEGSRTHRWL